jgi:flagellar motor switch/type III secretory pathway protein FliN
MPDETTSLPSPGNTTEPSAASALLLQKVESESHGDGKDASRAARKPYSEGSTLAGLPMQLDVTIPVPSFRVQDLLALEKGAVLESRWPHAEDVPVWCGGVQLVWTEFEVVDQKLAVRVTRLG